MGTDGIGSQDVFVLVHDHLQEPSGLTLGDEAVDRCVHLEGLYVVEGPPCFGLAHSHVCDLGLHEYRPRKNAEIVEPVIALRYIIHADTGLIARRLRELHAGSHVSTRVDVVRRRL